MTFLFGWGYAIYQYGWFLGLAFGWVPAGIIAAIVGALFVFLIGFTPPPFRAPLVYAIALSGDAAILYGLYRLVVSFQN